MLPATTTVERLCADALVSAERRIEERIASRLDAATRTALDELLSETMPNGTTRFVWLRQFEPGSNSAAAGRLLDRLEYLQRFDVCERLLEGVPAHRVARLRRQGERHFADRLREAADNRRLAILAVCVVEWRARLADTVVDTHDRIVGGIWRDAKRLCDARAGEARMAIHRTLCSFIDFGEALLLLPQSRSLPERHAMIRAIEAGVGSLRRSDGLASAGLTEDDHIQIEEMLSIFRQTHREIPFLLAERGEDEEVQ